MERFPSKDIQKTSNLTIKKLTIAGVRERAEETLNKTMNISVNEQVPAQGGEQSSVRVLTSRTLNSSVNGRMNNTSRRDSTGSAVASASSLRLTPVQLEKKLKEPLEEGVLGYSFEAADPPNDEETNRKYSLADAQYRAQMAQQDRAYFALKPRDATCLLLIVWGFRLLICLYFCAIFVTYIQIISWVKYQPSSWQIAGVNAVINQGFRFLNGLIVYWLAYYQRPKYISKLDKKHAYIRLGLRLTQYSYFFYTITFAEFFFSTPKGVNDLPWYFSNAKPCEHGKRLLIDSTIGKLSILTLFLCFPLLDDCQYQLFATFSKMLSFDVFVALVVHCLYPGGVYRFVFFGFEESFKRWGCYRWIYWPDRAVKKMIFTSVLAAEFTKQYWWYIVGCCGTYCGTWA